MASRVFFSFHYDGDIWRANQVRNSNVVAGIDVAGFFDRFEYEEAEKKGVGAIRRMILRDLAGTSVTVVLIGKDTANRPWVREEIKLSIAQNNGLLGIYIHRLGDRYGQTGFWQPTKPAVPSGVEFPVYDWDGDLNRLRREIDAAGRRADAMRVSAASAHHKSEKRVRQPSLRSSGCVCAD
jgi:hypothetical protein